MSSPLNLPEEVEKRWLQIKEQFSPLEIQDKNQMVFWSKLDLKSLVAIAVIAVSALLMSFIWWTGSKWKIEPDDTPEVAESILIEKNTIAPAFGGEIYIHIYGEVHSPGVYQMPSGSRVFEALEVAGGQSTDRTLEINLAQILQDGDQVFIGELSTLSTSGGATSKSQSNQKDSCLNINLADLSALDTLPGIGPVMAQKIIDWREQNGKFKNITDLNKVKGIGTAKYADLEKLVCI
jgi:competence protein ComEA